MNAVKKKWRAWRASVVPFAVEQQYIAYKHYFLYQRLRKGEGNRTFEPFERYRCIFIHIPKNGGIAIIKSLFDGKLYGGHYGTSFYKVVYGRDFERYFKFAVVRNPWDRLVSAYHFLQKGGMYQGDAEWAREHLAGYDTFGKFIDGWLTRKSIYTRVHFVPQADYLCDRSGRVEVDYVGRFEEFAASYSEICRRLEVSDRALSHANKSERAKDYRAYYTNKQAERVAKLYARDIEQFGYSFDPS
jgi:hypothetical protein